MNQNLTAGWNDLMRAAVYGESLERRANFFATTAARGLSVCVHGTDCLRLALQLARTDQAHADRIVRLLGGNHAPVSFSLNGSPRIVARKSDGRIEEVRDCDRAEPERVVRWSVSTGQPCDDRQVTAVTAEESVAAWAALAGADVSVLVCSGSFSDAQRLFLETTALWELPLHVTLVQWDGDADAADSNGLAARQLGVEPRVFVGKGACPPDFEQWLAIETERHLCSRESRFAAELLVESVSLLEMQDAERSALCDAANAARPDTGRHAADEAEAAVREALRLRDTRWPVIDAESRKEIDRHFQSAGPIMQRLEAELEKIPLLTLSGWDRQAERVDRALAVLTGLFVAQFRRRLRDRVQTLAGDMFASLGSMHVPAWDMPLELDPAAMPRIHAPAVWTTYLGAAIKHFISQRAVPRTGMKVLDPALGKATTVVGIATGAHQFKKTVQDEFQSQASLKIMPCLSGAVTPALNDAIAHTAQTLDGEIVQVLESYATQARELNYRILAVADLAASPDGRALIEEGVERLNSSAAAIKQAIGRIAAARSEAEARVRALDSTVHQYGRNLLSAECARTTRDPSFLPLVNEAAATAAAWASKRFGLAADHASAAVHRMLMDHRSPAAPLDQILRIDLLVVARGANELDYKLEVLESKQGRVVRTSLPLPFDSTWDRTPAGVRTELRRDGNRLCRLLYATNAAAEPRRGPSDSPANSSKQERNCSHVA